MTGILTLNALATNSSSTSQEVIVPSGFTLVGIDVAEATSTTFTIAHALVAGGTYNVLKDALGIYESSPGDPLTFTVGSTALGIYFIPTEVSNTLFSRIKVVLGSSESIPCTLIFKSIA